MATGSWGRSAAQRGGLRDASRPHLAWATIFSPPTQRFISLVSALFVGLFGGLGASAAQAEALPEPLVLEVVYDSPTDVISVKSRGTPLGAVLREISRKTRLAVSLPKEVLDERITVELSRVPLEHALKRLLEGANSTFVYDLAGDASSQARKARLVKVVVLSKKKRPGDRPDHSLSSQLASDQGERQEIVDALLGRLDNGGFPPDDGVLAALRELAPEQVTEALVHRLRASDAQTRVLAAAALGRLAQEGAIESLLSLLAEDDGATRQVAATSLALTGGAKATDSLLRAYAAGSNAMRYAIAVAIASHGDAHAQTALASLAAAGPAPRQPTAQEVGFINPNVR